MNVPSTSAHISDRTVRRSIMFVSARLYACFFSNLMFMFRPLPFRVENADTGEALSLWHLTSPAPLVPVDVEKTEYGPEVIPSSHPKKQLRSFVLRRHALTGPLLPLQLVSAAISSTVCFLHQNNRRRANLNDLINLLLMFLLLQNCPYFGFNLQQQSKSYVQIHIIVACRSLRL